MYLAILLFEKAELYHKISMQVNQNMQLKCVI